MAINQAYIFLIFTIDGILIGFLFDIFRILRKSFKTNDLITYIEDIIFWIIVGIIILFSLCKFCDGELRCFTFIGIILGVVLYMLSISSYIINIFVYVIKIIKKICNKLFKLTTYPFKLMMEFIRKIIYKPVLIMCINTRNLILHITNKMLNQMKNVKKTKKSKNFI